MSLLTDPVVVTKATSGATSDDTAGIMTTLGFQWHDDETGISGTGIAPAHDLAKPVN